MQISTHANSVYPIRSRDDARPGGTRRGRDFSRESRISTLRGRLTLPKGISKTAHRFSKKRASVGFCAPVLVHGRYRQIAELHDVRIQQAEKGSLEEGISCNSCCGFSVGHAADRADERSDPGLEADGRQDHHSCARQPWPTRDRSAHNRRSDRPNDVHRSLLARTAMLECAPGRRCHAGRPHRYACVELYAPHGDMVWHDGYRRSVAHPEPSTPPGTDRLDHQSR